MTLLETVEVTSRNFEDTAQPKTVSPFELRCEAKTLSMLISDEGKGMICLTCRINLSLNTSLEPSRKYCEY